MSFFKNKTKLTTTKPIFSLLVFYLSEAGEHTPVANQTVDGIGGLITRLVNIVNFLLSLLIPVATIAVIFAGFQYLTSAGNPDMMQKAKTNLLWIVIGLITIIVAKSLIIFVLSALGINYSLFGL